MNHRPEPTITLNNPHNLCQNILTADTDPLSLKGSDNDRQDIFYNDAQSETDGNHNQVNFGNKILPGNPNRINTHCHVHDREPTLNDPKPDFTIETDNSNIINFSKIKSEEPDPLLFTDEVDKEVNSDLKNWISTDKKSPFNDCDQVVVNQLTVSEGGKDR